MMDPIGVGLTVLLGFLHLDLGLSQCPHQQENLVKASDSTTWPQFFSPSRGSNLTLTFPLLLDRDTPALSGLIIESGGQLIFSPSVTSVSLTADFIFIRQGGALMIGSEECPFTGQAEIVLTGDRHGGVDLPDIGGKVVVVGEGGKLELHGREVRSWTRLVENVVPGEGLSKIQLEDDVTSWRKGDDIVMASTDYDLDQAEQVKVVNCTGRSCLVSGPIVHPHHGQIEAGVDMRGEVGLLTRNIKIHGSMNTNKDTFGGHVMAREGFSTFRVANVELYNMGQLGVNGRYPLHWHMAGKVDPAVSYVRNNALHHNFQRCVVCHGTMGCLIQRNVAHETRGHCFMLEDGVEAGAVLTGNLGLGTRKGKLIPSDQTPATFWITHPQVTLEGNVAAGSLDKGIWFLFPSLPTGVSGERQEDGILKYYEEDELYYTPLGKVAGNKAHSNTIGIMFDGILLPDQGAEENKSKYKPKQDPKDRSSSTVETLLEDMTCYKARRTCVWVNIENGRYSGAKVADAMELMFIKGNGGVVDNSLFVGESELNHGVPNRRVGGENWHRSLPNRRRGIGAVVGARTYLNNILIRNSHFVNFVEDEAKQAAALMVARSGPRSVHTGVMGIKFTNVPVGNRMKEPREFMRKGRRGKGGRVRQTVYHDWDGSLTQTPNTKVVVDLPHLTSPQCSPRPSWGNLSLCPHQFVSLPVGKVGTEKYGHAITRDDQLIHSFTPDAEKENHYLLNAHYSYIIHANKTIPPRIPLRFRNVDSGVRMRIGVCLPVGAEIRMRDAGRMKPAASMEEIMEARDGESFYHDQEMGVVFFVLKGVEERQMGDTRPCGNVQGNKACSRKTIIIQNKNDVNMREADCRERTGLRKKYSTLLDIRDNDF